MDTPAAKTDAPATLGKARMLHTMIRVHDLDKSIKFYTELLGMKLLRRTDYPEGKFTNVFVGYGDESSHTELELTHNCDHAPYNLCDDYCHIALGVPDVHAACDRLPKAGANVPPPARPVNSGTT